MDFWTRLFALTLVLAVGAAATPALAQTPLPACQTRGGTGISIPFPKGDASDLALARSVLTAVSLGFEVKAAMPACSRGGAQSALGDLELGGENTDEPLARTVYRADGQPGVFGFLAKAPGDASPTPTYVLVFARQEGVFTAHRLYAGLPNDEILLNHLTQVPGETDFILAMRRMPGGTRGEPAMQVSYGFVPPPGGPPARVSGTAANGSSVEAGPQFKVSDGSPAHLDMALRKGAVTHRPSGLPCAQILLGGALMLQEVDATPTTLHCAYREGPGLTFDSGANVKYRLIIARERASVASVMKDLIASARKAMPIKADKTPPLAAGRAPQPEAAKFWTLTDGSVQGLWLGKTGDWVIRLQASYPETPANDAEARRLAEFLFRELHPASR